MDMVTGEQIANAQLPDWRKLAQGLHSRFLIVDFTAGAQFVVDVGQRATPPVITRVCGSGQAT